jgi:hypothetical protein
MDPELRVRAHLYCDDGHPESRDYDSNYVPLTAPEPRHWLSVLFRLRAARASEAADDAGTAHRRTGGDDRDRRRRA